MSEASLRVALVLGVALVVLVVVLWGRARPGSRAVGSGGLDPGVYLFSSATCAACETARDRLRSALGSDGFHEITWESQPELFDRLEMEQVPSTLVVDDRGRARLYPGSPDGVLEELGP